ncbi:hypothetical protein GCM10022233_82950 [Streptomyces shaanxiensis]|uniref:Uncharacterized protein n=1 Tax=Streptomyces shaanxiensis TaxID=653357 RepID=A0ABP7WFB7_9ACTN
MNRQAQAASSPTTCTTAGTDPNGNAHIAITGQEDHYLTDTREALRTLIRDIKSDKAEHLLQPKPPTPTPTPTPTNAVTQSAAHTLT